MSLSILVLSILVAAGALAVLYCALSQYRKAVALPAYKPRRATTLSGKKPQPATILYPFRATSIQPADLACSAVQSIAGERFLVQGEAIPALPLDACDMATSCSCRYIKYRDRRQLPGERRVAGDAQQHPPTCNDIGDRRSGRERRTRRVAQAYSTRAELAVPG